MANHPPYPSDTSAEALEVLLRIYRDMPAWRKVQLVDDAIRTARQLGMAGLRSRFPGETRERLHRRLLGIVLGEDLARQVYGPIDSAP